MLPVFKACICQKAIDVFPVNRLPVFTVEAGIRFVDPVERRSAGIGRDLVSPRDIRLRDAYYGPFDPVKALVLMIADDVLPVFIKTVFQRGRPCRTVFGVTDGLCLLIGQSGVGKTTLIRAILGDDQIEAVEKTDALRIYENDRIPFRLIDTIGFEPKHDRRAVAAIQKWSRDSAKKGRTDTKIDLIWFCVDGTSGRIFEQTIRSVLKSVKMWKGVPIVMVITKSYSVPERENNSKLIQNALFKCKAGLDVREILPVVAEVYRLDENAFAPPFGLDRLTEVTNALLPEGIRAGETAIQRQVLLMKRGMAQGLIVSATGAAVAVGAIPFVNLADAAILTPMEIGSGACECCFRR